MVSLTKGRLVSPINRGNDFLVETTILQQYSTAHRRGRFIVRFIENDLNFEPRQQLTTIWILSSKENWSAWDQHMLSGNIVPSIVYLIQQTRFNRTNQVPTSPPQQHKQQFPTKTQAITNAVSSAKIKKLKIHLAQISETLPNTTKIFEPLSYEQWSLNYCFGHCTAYFQKFKHGSAVILFQARAQ